MLPQLSSPTEIIPVKCPVGDPLSGYQFLECIAHAAGGETWTARANDGRDRLIRFFVGINGEAAKVEERLSLLRELRHDALESMELVGAAGGRLALLTDACPTTLATRFQECQASGSLGIPRPELLARLMVAAEALDDLFEEHSVRHLGLTPKHLVLRNGKLLLRYFGVVEWIQLPAGQQAVALNPRYACAGNLRRNAPPGLRRL